MRLLYLLDELGRPYTVRDVVEWAIGYSELVEAGGTVIARDEVGATVVSTVFLGLDHSHGKGSRQIYETATFEPFRIVGRWATREEAMTGHRAEILALRAWGAARPS